MTTVLNPTDISSSSGTAVFLPTELFKQLPCVTIGEINEPDALGLIPSHYLACVAAKINQGSFGRQLLSVMDEKKTRATGFVVHEQALWRVDDPHTRNLDLHIYCYYTTLDAAYRHFSGNFNLQISSVGEWITTRKDV